MIASIQVGPFTLHRVGDRLLVHYGFEGGPMPLADFEREVCPWSEVEKADEEKVADFYSKYF